ncbi:hypothetical protein D3C75_997750 [compost metagenome]
MSGLEVDIGEIHFFFTFLCDGHRSDNHINFAVVQHGNACFGGHFFQLNRVFIAENVLGNRFGDVNVEAFHFARSRILQPEQPGIVLHANQQLAAFLNFCDGFGIRAVSRSRITVACIITLGIVVAASGNHQHGRNHQHT